VIGAEVLVEVPTVVVTTHYTLVRSLVTTTLFAASFATTLPAS
jgi:hypothetical protein